MHELINKSLQSFVQDTYGNSLWEKVVEKANLPEPEFEAMLHYDDALVEQVIEASLDVLDRDRAGFLEDLGTYLVSHPKREALRRLLRFCGTSFIEFLHALDDLPGRVRLAIPDLEFPALDLRQFGAAEFLLTCDWKTDAAAHVMLGVIRAIADDYGALALFEAEGSGGGRTVRITLLDHSFAEGRAFALGGSAA